MKTHRTERTANNAPFSSHTQMKILFLAALLFLSSFCLAQEFRSNGNVGLNIAPAPYPKIVKQDGIDLELNYEIIKKEGENYDIKICPKAGAELSKFAAYPVYKEGTLDKNLDISKGCINYPVDFGKTDSIKIGEHSTIIEIVSDNLVFLISPEAKECDYLYCESEITIKNDGDHNVTIDPRMIDVSIDGYYEISYLDKVTYMDGEDVAYQEGIMHPYRDLTIAPGEEITFLVDVYLSYPIYSYKYGVSIVYLGVNYSIDPYFYTGLSNFNSGTFTNTLLNASGFVQLNNSLTGNYSFVFNASSPVIWKNLTLNLSPVQEMPSGNVIERYPHGLNMTDCLLLLHMDEASGNPIDYCGGNVPQSTNLLTYGVPGKVKDAIGFNGVGSHIKYPNTSFALDTGDSFSMGGWIYLPVNITTSKNIFTRANRVTERGFEFYIERPALANGINLLLINTLPTNYIQVYSAGKFYAGKWYHIAVTYNGNGNASGIKFYYNGVQQTTLVSVNTLSGGTIKGNGTLTLGQVQAGWISYNGYEDEMFIFNRTLTATEIKDIYRRGLYNERHYYRACDDLACSGESYIGPFNTTPQTFSTTPLRFLEYRVDFMTENASYSPELWGASAGYELFTTFNTLTSDFVNNSQINLSNISYFPVIARFVSWNETNLNITMKINGTYEDSIIATNDTDAALYITSINETGSYRLTLSTKYDSLTYYFTVYESTTSPPLSNSSLIAVAILILGAVFILAYLGTNTKNDILKMLLNSFALLAISGLSHIAWIISKFYNLGTDISSVIFWFTIGFISIFSFMMFFTIYSLVVYVISYFKGKKSQENLFDVDSTDRGILLK